MKLVIMTQVIHHNEMLSPHDEIATVASHYYISHYSNIIFSL